MSVRAEGDQLDVAQHALEQAEWERARMGFEAVLEVGDSAPAYEGLGLALWFLGRVADGIAAREQAFEAYARDGRCGDAARVAVWVSHQHAIDGRSSAARGWLARAERVLTEVGRCAGHGWVALQRARTAPAVSDQIAYAHQAMEIARAEGDSDLEVYALSVLGKGEVNAGHRDTGMGLLEEAMAAASAGRVRNVHTLGSAYCNLVVACTSAGDWERAREWCELVDDFARSHDAAPLLGACRTIHADMLLATGRWPEAERALQSALAVHARYVPGMDASTVATLAALRIQQGRLADAAQLLAGREEQPPSLRALALLRIAEGQPRVAVALLERGLQATGGNAMQATALLATLVDARLAAGQVEPAGTAAAQLEGIAADTGIRLVRARAELARARVVLAGPSPREAAEPARRALADFGGLAMPLDAGEARLELARALGADSAELAAEEVRAALAVFRALGAARATDAAAALLRELGGATGGRPQLGTELTAREHEVLALVARGMSNARIARTLVISEKTAGHHVSRILTKLGVHNRTEAAAYAARQL
ncbi:MAG TPA: LuxR C-terminal-related transcriptional regulator [Microlunatus sp.]